MDNSKLENKADTPDRRTKGEIIEDHKKDIEAKDVEIEALKKKIGELNDSIVLKDRRIEDFESVKKEDNVLVDVEYVKECCGIEKGFVQQLSNADAAMMVEKGYVKISD